MTCSALPGFGLVLCSMLAIAGPAVDPPSSFDLNFQDRVRAQAAIERVNHSHRNGTTTEFELAVPRSILEKKVRRFLRQSRALEQQWKTPVTADMLDRELARMIRDTHDADRLWELFAALDSDPVRIRECLARPILVDRLVRNFFATDVQLHAETRREAERLHEELLDGRVDPSAVHPRRTVEQASDRTSDESFRDWRSLAPDRVGEVSDVVERYAAIEIRVVLADGPGLTRVASYSIPRLDPERWWNGFEAVPVSSVARRDAELPTRDMLQDCGPGEWRTHAEAPYPRSRHVALWTGSEMIIWAPSGGDEGSRYDPATDTWTAMSGLNAPDLMGDGAPGVWTGSEMIVFGEQPVDSPPVAAGRYDPVTDTWTPISVPVDSVRRGGHSAIWTGDEMIIWGGRWHGHWDDGWRYNPDTGLWRHMTTTGAPEGREGHTAVWTGDRMIVWGGNADSVYYANGAAYDPGTDTWTPLSNVGAPEIRTAHSGVWTGDAMIIWGGAVTTLEPALFHENGFRYIPGTDSWSPISVAPGAKAWHSTVWTGDRMIVWGGSDHETEYGSSWLPITTDTGYGYDPDGDEWTVLSDSNSLSRRQDHTAVWTGDTMIVWGGGNWTMPGGWASVGTGGRYDPSTDGWTPTASPMLWAMESDATRSRVWTGNELIVWGGRYYSSFGTIHDLTTGAQTYTSLIDAPTRRNDHSAVWTGTEMIVWGGVDESQGSESELDSGGRYDPLTDSWIAISRIGAPSGRTGHSVAWTGNELIVWGGYDSGALASGGRYDPRLDRWQPMTHFGAPDRRYYNSAVWTGVEMIVWGGHDGANFLGDGAGYDPAANQWTPLSSLNAPTARSGHMGIWTGAEMIIWAGNDGGEDDPHPRYIETGFLDLPDVDGDGLCGPDDCDDANPFCGADCTDADADAFCVTTDCDDSNANCTTDCTDADSDEYCVTHDCDESNSDTYPGAPEVNDGLDNQCPGDTGRGLVDEISGVCGFFNSNDRNEFSWPVQTGATDYEVARSTDGRFRERCLVTITGVAYWVDTEPVPEETCHYYLAHSLIPNIGSWGRNSAGVERTDICP